MRKYGTRQIKFIHRLSNLKFTLLLPKLFILYIHVLFCHQPQLHLLSLSFPLILFELELCLLHFSSLFNKLCLFLVFLADKYPSLICVFFGVFLFLQNSGHYRGKLISQLFVLLLVLVCFLVGSNLLDKNNVNDFTEFVFNQLVIHDVQYFCWKRTVFPTRITFSIQNLWVIVLLYDLLED